MARRIPTLQETFDPNSQISREARGYQAAVEREYAAAQARGLTGAEAIAEARYRASVVVPQQEMQRRGRLGGMIFLAAIAGAIIWAYRAGELTTAFLPELTAVTILFFLFYIAQAENQRWVRVRATGMQGASRGFGAFVDFTGVIAMIFGYAWPIAYGYDFGWRAAVGLFVVGWLIMMVFGMLTTTVIGMTRRAFQSERDMQYARESGMGGDWFVLWMLGTLAADGRSCLHRLLVRLAGEVRSYGHGGAGTPRHVWRTF
jgi:hypothetical protein